MEDRIYFKNNSFYFKKVNGAIEISKLEYERLIKGTYSNKIIIEEDSKLTLIDRNIDEIKEMKLYELDFKITNLIYSKYKITKQINLQREYYLNPNNTENYKELVEMNLFINSTRENFHKIEDQINNLSTADELNNLNIDEEIQRKCEAFDSEKLKK